MSRTVNPGTDSFTPVLAPGEAAEFDTHVPHWFGPAGAEAVELLSLFGKQGERAHLRARPKK